MDEFKQCHPKQIIGEIIPVPVWKVIYNYITARGNPKTATKYLFLTENSWDLIDNEFNSYIESLNQKHPERKLSKELILDNSNEGDIVFDPCAGSVAHLLVAKENNRNWLGVELNREYFNISKSTIIKINLVTERMRQLYLINWHTLELKHSMFIKNN